MHRVTSPRSQTSGCTGQATLSPPAETGQSCGRVRQIWGECPRPSHGSAEVREHALGRATEIHHGDGINAPSPEANVLPAAGGGARAAISDQTAALATIRSWLHGTLLVIEVRLSSDHIISRGGRIQIRPEQHAGRSVVPRV